MWYLIIGTVLFGALLFVLSREDDEDAEDADLSYDPHDTRHGHRGWWWGGE